jgi:glutathione S-transferase
MLTLRSSPLSPFGRKVVAAIELFGMSDRVKFVAANTTDPQDTIRTQNPLGKIPALILENGDVLFDSRVIIEYINELDGRNILIPAGMARFDALRRQALADGILDAAILQVYEVRFRPTEHHVQSWLDHQSGKVSRALKFAEGSVKPVKFVSPELPDIGDIALASSLGYLDFRFAGEWRKDHPKLVAWLAAFEQAAPGFKKSAPQ